jgi:hypothetical protein
MRSSLIFSVSAKFTNRYLLCRILSASARKMYRQGASAAQNINRSLQALHDSEGPGKKPASPAEAENSELKDRAITVLAP